MFEPRVSQIGPLGKKCILKIRYRVDHQFSCTKCCHRSPSECPQCYLGAASSRFPSDNTRQDFGPYHRFRHKSGAKEGSSSGVRIDWKFWVRIEMEMERVKGRGSDVQWTAFARLPVDCFRFRVSGLLSLSSDFQWTAFG